VVRLEECVIEFESTKGGKVDLGRASDGAPGIRGPELIDP